MPKRVTSKFLTCIDHVITRFLIETRNLKNIISDHFALEASILRKSCAKDQQVRYQKLNRKLENIKGDGALNFLSLLDQKLKSND